jgi:hypothetical protein
MSTPSNLYAEKVFSEHPTGLWALDDGADYISLISEQQRNLSSWTVYGGTASAYLESVGEPFTDSYVGKIVANPILDKTASITAISPEIVNLNELNSYLRTFSVGGYFYSESSYISGFSIGYQYRDPTSGTDVRHIKNFDTVVNSNWLFISETFDAPPEDALIRIVFKINFVGDEEASHVFRVNGITLGQWSEEFASSSLGTNVIDIPETISLAPQKGIVAKCYGLQELNAYYLVSDNMIKAKNSGIPLVYGTPGHTTLLPNDGLPSLIVPGVGMLNDLGQFRQYTLETWIRINSYTNDRKRIIGPIGSTDGIYVDGPSIGLKVGNEYKTNYVGEWTRPMLVHLKVGQDIASILINGEEVIAIPYSQELANLPSEFIAEKNQDWIGFYAYDDISPIDIDCVGIYPYLVPSAVAKRRFVFGQGVEIPENINTSYSGTSIAIDYSFANYTANYSYPKTGSWNQGFSDNLLTTNKAISVIPHPLPETVLSSRTESELFNDNKSANSTTNIQEFLYDERDYFTFRPTTSSWNTVRGHLFFKNFDSLNTPISAFYGCFQLKNNIIESQTLFKIEKENTSDYFKIDVANNKIRYIIYVNKKEEILYQSQTLDSNEFIEAGVNIPRFVEIFGNPVSNFFGSLSDLRLYVGGDKDDTAIKNSTFTGKIYNVGLATKYNFQKIKKLFNEIGIPKLNEDLFNAYLSNQLIDVDGGLDTVSEPPFGGITDVSPGAISGGGVVLVEEEDYLIEHTASYTLVPDIIFEKYTLAVSANAYWEDNLPLTYFAESVFDKRGDQYFDLDFIQFNFNYPIPTKTIAIETDPVEWTYAELANEYGTPIQRNYDSLDNYLFTGYNDYEDLKNKIAKDYKYDTDGSLVKTYVTFQYTELGANAIPEYFVKIERPARNGVLIPGPDWMRTKYEVVDNMIIYPPSGVDFNDLSIVTHIEINVKNSLVNNVSIKKMSYSSQALNESDASPIGTRFGTPIYPYTKSGIYYDFKKNNPFSIYNASSPYLYLTKTSGIQLKGRYDPLVNRGLMIPINSSRADGFKVIAMQLAVRFDGDYFPYAPTEIFEVESKGSYIKFYLVACDPSGRRAKIYAIDTKTGLVQNGIGFYWNGKIVKEPVVTLQDWGFLGINFSDSLDFSYFEGAIRLTGPLLFNNISFYQSTNLQEVQNVSERPWFRVKVLNSSELDWKFWNIGSFNWNKVLVLSETSYYGVNPSEVYKSYTGTNKIIVDDDSLLRFGNYRYTAYSDVNWNQLVVDPA